ncbi:hypothetical protein [Rhodovulum sp. P5]|uniref:hypothetical protein n=1 Tax=Rhodovulum sp. P5 TaxID=1564506 RepID=UPI0015607457|nr:hypothetical protein [Rhodovulum sp. P5]
MKHEWLIDILGDLKNYARKNGMGALAEELSTCQALAAVEISSIEAHSLQTRLAVGAPLKAVADNANTGNGRRLRLVSGPAAAGNDA